MRHLQPLITPLASWPIDVMHREHRSTASLEETKFGRESSSTSTCMCHQGGLCSMAVTAMPLKASFRFMRSSLLQQDPTIPQEAWFTIPSPCFYRAWLCKWNWWRPQPRVTESSGIIADLQCLQSHSVTLMSPQHAPGGDSLRPGWAPSAAPLRQQQQKKDFPPLSPLSLTPELTVQEPL